MERKWGISGKDERAGDDACGGRRGSGVRRGLRGVRSGEETGGVWNGLWGIGSGEETGGVRNGLWGVGSGEETGGVWNGLWGIRSGKCRMTPYFAFQWHITDNCDQRCRHCYIFSEDNCRKLTEMNYADMEKTLHNCLDMCEKLSRTPYFYITGGDPILHPGFWRLLELLKKRGITFAVMGNPFHLNDEICRRLFDYGCRKYQLSLDGLKVTHDSFRKPGSFETTLEKIGCIRRAGMYCAIMSTVSKTNMEEIPELIDIVVEKQADVFAVGRYCPTSEEKSGTFHMEPLEYRAYLEKCWEKYEQYKNCGTTFQLKDHLWTLFLYEKGIFKIPENLRPGVIYDGCHCGICHMTILPTGGIYACRRMESRIGNALTDSMADLFLGDKMDQYRQYGRFEKCAGCELLGFCRGCPAVAFGYTGNMYAPDPQCWKTVCSGNEWDGRRT